MPPFPGVGLTRLLEMTPRSRHILSQSQTVILRYVQPLHDLRTADLSEHRYEHEDGGAVPAVQDERAVEFARRRPLGRRGRRFGTVHRRPQRGDGDEVAFQFAPAECVVFSIANAGRGSPD